MLTLELKRWLLLYSLWKRNPVPSPWKTRDQEEVEEEVVLVVGLLIKGMDYLFAMQWHLACFFPHSCCGLPWFAWLPASHWLYCSHIWSDTQFCLLTQPFAVTHIHTTAHPQTLTLAFSLDFFRLSKYFLHKVFYLKEATPLPTWSEKTKQLKRKKKKKSTNNFHVRYFHLFNEVRGLF